MMYQYRWVCPITRSLVNGERDKRKRKSPAGLISIRIKWEDNQGTRCNEEEAKKQDLQHYKDEETGEKALLLIFSNCQCTNSRPTAERRAKNRRRRIQTVDLTDRLRGTLSIDIVPRQDDILPAPLIRHMPVPDVVTSPVSYSDSSVQGLHPGREEKEKHKQGGSSG